MKFEMNVKGRKFEVEVREDNKVYATDSSTLYKMLLTEKGEYANKSDYRNSINKKFDFEALEELDKEIAEEDKLVTMAEYGTEIYQEEMTDEEVDKVTEENKEEAEMEHPEDDEPEVVEDVIARCLPKYVTELLVIGVKTEDGYKLVVDGTAGRFEVSEHKWMEAKKEIVKIVKGMQGK